MKPYPLVSDLRAPAPRVAVPRASRLVVGQELASCPRRIQELSAEGCPVAFIRSSLPGEPWGVVHPTERLRLLRLPAGGSRAFPPVPLGAPREPPPFPAPAPPHHKALPPETGKAYNLHSV